ncbi:unnamed protein product [Closterium sp. NIES-65]|nr:unnamed protein product [Closterium sp. NIES-65]
MHLGPLSLPLFLHTLFLTFPLTLPSLHLLILISHTPLLFPIPQTLPLPLPLLFFTPRPLTPPLTSLLTPPLTSLLTPPLILVPTLSLPHQPIPPFPPPTPQKLSPPTPLRRQLRRQNPFPLPLVFPAPLCPNPLPLFLPLPLPLPLCLFSPVPASLGGNLPFTPPNRVRPFLYLSRLSRGQRYALAECSLPITRCLLPCSSPSSPVTYTFIPSAQRLAVLFMCILSHVRRGNPNFNRNLVESLYCN